MATATKPHGPAGAIRLVWKQESVRADCDTARVRRWQTVDDAYRVEERTDTYGEPLVRYIALRREGFWRGEPHYGLVGTIEARRRWRRGDRLVYRRKYLEALRRRAMRLCEEDASERDTDE
jgi:hypothetical protein